MVPKVLRHDASVLGDTSKHSGTYFLAIVKYEDIRDSFPVSPGHTLIVPRRHILSFFEITAAEREDMLLLLDQAKAKHDAEFRPDARNIGINDGPAAGQTAAHLHIHLIPRHAGDSADPRGGARWVLPDKAKYWP